MRGLCCEGFILCVRFVPSKRFVICKRFVLCEMLSLLIKVSTFQPSSVGSKDGRIFYHLTFVLVGFELEDEQHLGELIQQSGGRFQRSGLAFGSSNLEVGFRDMVCCLDPAIWS